jgi:hypothetical protein
LSHERGRDLATKMSLAGGVVGEGVEDPKLRWAEADREPGGGGRFLLRQG